jgi:dipeptidyl-peptidase-4
MMRNAAAAALLLASTALAQQVTTQPPKPTVRELTIENIFDPKEKIAFSGAQQSGFVWLDEKTVTWPRTNERSEVVEQTVLDTETGARRTLFSAAKLEAAARKIAGVGADQAKHLAQQRNWNFSPNKKSVVLALGGDLYLWNLDADAMTRLTSSPGEKQEAGFSPDGRFISYVRNNNLYVVDVATQRERQLTTDGNDDILNGVLDWVYQEEIFGRGTFHAYWWSPDSSRIAYIQLDERPVKRFTVVDHIPLMQNLEVTPYPKSGLPNPRVKLFTVSAGGAAPQEVDTQAYSAGEILVVGVTWTPDSKRVVYQIQNREQTWLDLDAADVPGGTPTTLFRETTKAWVEPSGDPQWLKDGSFLWLSERSGYKHLYHYGADGKLLRQITDGPWEVRTLHGADASNQSIYFSGTERSVLGTDVYRVALDGSGLKRISGAPGNHIASFNPSMSLWIDSWTDIQTPTRISLARNDGTEVRVVEANDVAALRDLRISKPEFVQVKARDGFVLEGVMFRPPDFDPSRKYPVFEHTYSGPHAQQVRNQWFGSTYLWHQLLAQRGIIVWVCDNRTASGKGAASAWPAYKNFGELELRDLEDGLKWLTSQPYVDGSRVLLNGWSFGGFMTTYALTHSTLWSAGIAGGSVTDWHDYDSVYTERYMLMPQNNPDGYQKSAPRFAAKDLHGNLLLLHGAIDDNVHLQNTMQLAYELEKAGKVFDMMLYPKSRHGVTDPLLVTQMRRLMLRFIERNLLSPNASQH